MESSKTIMASNNPLLNSSKFKIMETKYLRRALFTLLLFCPMLFISCTEELPETEPGIFRPLYVDGQIVVTGNSIQYAWYGIKGAASYTFEISADSFKTAPIRSVVLEETKIKVEGLGYEASYLARVRANAQDGSTVSGWMLAPIQTVEKRVVAYVLNNVDRMQITNTSARITWNKGFVNDSLSIKAVNTSEPARGIKLSANDIANAYYDFTQLTPNSRYEVTIYNSKNASVVDRAYNSVLFQTSGAPAGAIIVNPGENLAQILVDASTDATIPSGTTFYLPSGGVYYFASFPSGSTTFDTPTSGRGMTFRKAFNLVGSSSGVRPKIYMTSDWKPEGQFDKGIRFEGIDFEGLRTVGTSTFNPYLFNINASTLIPEIQLIDCRFINFIRAIISCNQDDATPATVKKIVIDNCVFSSPAADGYAILHGNKNTNNFLSDVTIRNSTFANMPKAKGMVGNVNKIVTPVKMSISNCTFYNSQAVKESFIDLSGANANLTIENCLFGSPFESTMVKTGSGTTNATFNYATSEFLAPVNSINPTVLTGVPATALWVKPDDNDFTIKLKDSPAYTRRIGDPRWIK
jgi:hypothetical protein